MRRAITVLVLILATTNAPVAQSPREFDVVSIKPNTSSTIGFRLQGIRNGRATLTNVTVHSALSCV